MKKIAGGSLRCGSGSNRKRSRRSIYLRSCAYSLTAGALFSMAFIPVTEAYAISFSNATQSYRDQVIKTCGIADCEDPSAIVTRAEFAEMAVRASKWKDTVSATNTVAAANDVPGSHQSSGYVRTALRNGLMRTKLGGNFEPDSPVTLNDAIKAALTLLGYTDEDFGSDVATGRLSMFRSLDLDDGLNASNTNDSLTAQDCINLFYNLLKTNSKDSSSIYGTLLDVSLSSDGEIDATDLMETEMEGPLLIKSYSQLEETLPFPISGARLYYNGKDVGNYMAAQRYYSSQINREGWLVVYYSEAQKTVWAYGTDDGTSELPYYCVAGKLNAVYYTASNIVSPSSVLVGSQEYELSGSDVKFMFSINGDIEVGDEVILIVQRETVADSEGTEDYVYYCTGVLRYADLTGTTSAVVLPVDASFYNANTGERVDRFGNVTESSKPVAGNENGSENVSGSGDSGTEASGSGTGGQASGS